jgi:hypothetical protein
MRSFTFDRIVQNCIWLETGKFNVREHLGQKCAALESAMPKVALQSGLES